IMKRAHQIAKTLEGDYRSRMSIALRQAWMEAKKEAKKESKKGGEKGMKKNYASYHIDGSKADEFRAAALELFASKEVLVKVTGDTYPARYILREAGFQWNKYEKAYFGDKSAKAELDRISTASYSRANQKLVAALKFEEIEKGPELKKELQWRMCNLDRETMSFDIFAGPDTPKDILE